MKVKEKNKINITKTVTSLDKNKNYQFEKYYILILLTVTIVLFSNTLTNNFTNWDDKKYLNENPYIKDLSFEGVKAIFTTPYFSNYHPLTTLSYALEYKLAGLDNPWFFYLNNYILHILNTLLVFFLIKRLSKRAEVSFITALLFAVHPMHVESVAWVSERKDVLYTFFFLLSLIFYIRFSINPKKIYILIISLLLFFFSLLSKSAAVVLPPMALLCVYYINKKITLKDIVYSIPFFILSLIFGIIALKTQEKAINDLTIPYNSVNRIFIVCYALYFYLVRFLFPYNFNALHKYPEQDNGILPYIYYIAPLFLILTISLVFFLRKEERRVYVYGLLFYLISISLVVQLISLGQAIVAERYTYVSYIGLSFVLAHFFTYLKSRYNKKLMITLGVIYSIFLAVSTWQQVKVWQNTITLWTHAIKIDPELKYAYQNRAIAKVDNKDLKGALADYNKAIEIDSTYAMAYYHRGLLYKDMEQLPQALSDFSLAIKYKPDFHEAYNMRGNVKSDLNELKSAILDYNIAIHIKADNEEYYFNRGLTQMNDEAYVEAINDFTKAIQLNPLYDEAFNSRGFAKTLMADYKVAIDDFNKAIALNPDFDMAYNNRAVVRAGLRDFENALSDFEKVISINPNDANAYFNMGLIYIELNNKEKGCEYFVKAQNSGYENAKSYILLHCN